MKTRRGFVFLSTVAVLAIGMLLGAKVISEVSVPKAKVADVKALDQKAKVSSKVNANPDKPLVVVEAEVIVPEDIVLPELSPYKYISQPGWENFLRYVDGGGKWILLNFYYEKGVQKQYFVAYKGKKLFATGPISAGKDNKNFLPGQKSNVEKHNHLGLFDVFYRSVKTWSHPGNCWMYYGLFYHRDHGFHSALPRVVKYVGSPDSGGCDRALLADAIKVYRWAGKDHIKVFTICERSAA